jgi:hypothetical protein
MPSHKSFILLLWIFLTTLATAQKSDGYVGYDLELEGDRESTIFSTDDTRPNAGINFPNPDVFLNASVHVGTIDIQVDNLTAKVNLDAQVLNLLQFNAGVDLSIDSVRLLIENVRAKVTLEARLENLVKMINTTLSSIDLNPVIAELGEGLGGILNDTGSIVGDLGSTVGGILGERSLDFELQQNILYSTNNYRADKHTNRILAQNGDIVAHKLDYEGRSLGTKVVGNYKDDMTFNGHEETVERNGDTVTEREYIYEPFPGLYAVAAVYISQAGNVVGTQLLAEARGGGTSTIFEE